MSRLRQMLHNASVMVEAAVERYRFTCVRCDGWWDDDYEVRVYADVEGTEFRYYRYAGRPCEAPLAADTLCPDCHCGPVCVMRLSQHELRTPLPAAPSPDRG